jgi:hypothetical protein
MATEKRPAADRQTYTNDFKPSDTDRAIFYSDPMIDNLLKAMIALSAEVWTGRRRVKVLESVLEKHAGISRELAEAYVPTAEETAQWQAERDLFVKTTFDHFLRQADTPYAAPAQPAAGKRKG